MSFRKLLLIVGWAVALMAGPASRMLVRSASASVVWGARTSWGNLTQVTSPDPGLHAVSVFR